MTARHPISRALLGKIVDEVFDGAIEDASVIEQIYAVIKAHDTPTPFDQLMVPEGYALVPIEPTRAMWAAMANTLYGYKNRHHDRVAGDLYKAMLAAASEGSADE